MLCPAHQRWRVIKAHTAAGKAETFTGKPCRICGETLRYVAQRACAACSTKRNMALVALKRERNRHIQAGAVFEGKPCRECGTTTRYEKTRTCALCNRTRSIKGRERSKPERHTPEFRKAVRDRGLFARYGVTSAFVDTLLLSQGGCCAICKAREPGGSHGWNLDHCHGSREIRGVLCMKCNCALGAFGDSPERLRAAIEYLTGDTRHARTFLVREADWLLSDKSRPSANATSSVVENS